MTNKSLNIKDLLATIDDDPELDISEEELNEIKNNNNFKNVYQKSKKITKSNEEEIIYKNDIDNFIKNLNKSIDGIELKLEDIKKEIDLENEGEIKNNIYIFNRDVHGLKGALYANGATTMGDILHGIEEITTQNILESNNVNWDDLLAFISEKISAIKEYAQMIKTDNYEININIGKRVIDEEGIKNSKESFVVIKNNIENFLKSKNNELIFVEKIDDSVEILIRNVRESRYKNFLINTKEELKRIKENIINKNKNNIIEKEKAMVVDYLNTAKEMFDLLIVGNSNYYNMALLNSKNDNINNKKKSLSEFISIEVDSLNNILTKLDEVKIETTQYENTIKTTESNSKLSIFLIESMTKTLQFFENFSDSKIQALSNEAKKDNDMFDPLEMDNYTELQEKTKTMKETLIDLKNILLNEEKNISIKKSANKIMNNGLQKINESLMSIRLKTVKAYLVPMIQKTVSLAAKDLDKDINLEIYGDHLEVDSLILDKLRDPLGHTLRNCVAHGIEDKKERMRLGKNPVGRIVCNFEQKNGKLTVNVSDDGSGINVKKVEKKAREKGVWTSDKPMSDQQAVDIICMPNFSTQDEANKVSGRGVGMDAVKNEIIKLNGRYDIVSKEGKGLNITIQIPTSLSNKDVLLVSCSKQKFAIPTELWADISIFEPSMLMECATKGKINFKGQEVDFRYLSDLVGISSDNNDKSECNYVVLLSDTGSYDSGIKIAIAVEKISKEMVTQVPIKTIGRTLSNVPGVTGTTILSDGRAAFIYDPVRAKIALLKHHGIDIIDEKTSLPLTDKNKNQNENHSKGLIMVVDDSPTVRKYTVRFLEKNGYNHITAVDGEDAKSKIINVMPDLILLDVEMPRMDGFEFAQYVKESEKLKHIPIIMITSRTAEKHKNKAIKIGVEDYIGKPFTSEVLLPSLKKLLNQY